MKKAVITTFLILSAGLALAHNDRKKPSCEDHPRLLDSVYVYMWDINQNAWDFSLIWHYESSEGRHDKLTFVNAKTRLARQTWEYFYNNDGNRYYEVSKILWAGNWDLYMQKENEFNENNQKTKQLTSFWRNSMWTLNYTYDYEYLQDKLVKYYYRKVNQYGSLYDVNYAVYTYPSPVLMEERDYNSSDNSLFRYKKYMYNTDGSIAELIMYSPDNSTPSADDYIPLERHVYTYDDLRLLRELNSYNWNGTGWQQAYKYNYFYRIDKAEKVSICHNNHTLCIPVEALKAHLAHGDRLGVCDRNKSDDVRGKEKREEIPFKVYPNPAKERITIRLEYGDEESCISRFDLVNSAGVIIRSVEVNGQNEIIIERGDLKSGKYMLRAQGDKVYSLIVIFN